MYMKGIDSQNRLFPFGGETFEMVLLIIKGGRLC